MTPFTLGPALLFCPADRPERYEKAAARADAVILDLEDAVTGPAKESARQTLIASRLDPATTVIRVNPADSTELSEDLRALRSTPYRTVMLAKTAGAAHVRLLAGYDVIALVETAAGVVGVADIAAEPNVVALMWGAEDLVASLGGTSSRGPDGRYRDVARHARSATLVAAAAYGKAAVDAIHLDITDLDGLAAEARDAVASGFSATACIHPSQVAVVRAAYLPSEEERAWAEEVQQAAVGRHGAFRWRDQLVDGPVLKHAEQLLRRAREARSASDS